MQLKSSVPHGCGIAAAALIAAFFSISSASAGFVGFVVTSTTVVEDEQPLVVYTVAARFDGLTDTLHRAFDLTAANNAWYQGFWHKDNNSDDLAGPMLSQSWGTWDPTRTGSATANRPYDSYLTIGGIASGGNTTRENYDDIVSAQFVSSGWDRTSLPHGSDFIWFNSEPGNQQGRVGNSPGLPSTDVRIGQFVLSEGHSVRTFSLSLKYNGGDWFDRDGDGESDDMTVATGSFTLGVPAPGALGVLLLGSLARGRRR